MANVTQGLFGFDPTQLAQQREEALQQRSIQYAQLSPMQSARASMFRAGSQLGDVGAGLLGLKDPALEAQSLMQQTAKTLDLKDPVAVRDVASKWLQSGNTTLQNKALQLHEVANKAEEEYNQRIKEKASIDLAARKAKQQQEFYKEYAEAPDADARLAVTRKYAEMPELIKIDEAALARKEKADAASVDREEKAAAKKDAQEALFQQQRFLAGENNKARSAISSDSRAASRTLKEIAQMEKQSAADAKQADLDAKASRSAQGGISHAEQMIADATDAKTLIKFETTGHTGRAAAAINPGGDAGSLRNRIATIKANLGFDRLQKMRDESPTGGALGQVAVQELEALQASVGSLDPRQSEAELTRNFDKVIKHYGGWRDAIKEDEKARVGRRAQRAATHPGAAPIAPAASSGGWGRAVEQ